MYRRHGYLPFDGDYNVNEPSYIDWLSRVNKDYKGIKDEIERIDENDKAQDVRLDNIEKEYVKEVVDGTGIQVSGDPYRPIVTNTSPVATFDNKTELEIRRVFRVNYENGRFDTRYDTTQAYPSFGQGAEVIGDGNIVIAYTALASDNRNNMTEAIIRVHSLSNGQVLREIRGDFGHCNGISYNPDTGKLYLAENSRYNFSTGVMEPSQRIHVMDYVTLQLEETFTVLGVNGNINDFPYDRVKKEFWVCQNSTKWRIDMTTKQASNPISLKYPENGKFGTGAGCIVHDSVFYTNNYAPNMILVHDTAGNLLKQFKYPLELEEYSNVGEVEAISLDPVTGYMYGVCAGYNCFQSGFFQTQVFKFSLDKNIISRDMVSLPNLQATIYVDPNSSSFNPDGTTSQPFKYLAEAIDYLHARKGNIHGYAYVTLLPGTHPYCFIEGVSNMEIVASEEGVIVDGLTFRGCSNIRLTGLTISNHHTNYTTPLDILNADLTLQSVSYVKSSSYDTMCIVYTGGKVKLLGDQETWDDQYTYYRLMAGSTMEDNLIGRAQIDFRSQSGIRHCPYTVASGIEATVPGTVIPLNGYLQRLGKNWTDLIASTCYNNIQIQYSETGQGGYKIQHFRKLPDPSRYTFVTEGKNLSISVVNGNLVLDQADTGIFLNSIILGN